MRIRIGLLVVAMLAGVAGLAGAQELAGTFDQLRVLIAPGSKITVIDASGQTVKGKVVTLSATALRLSVAGATRELAERDVDQIRERRADSLANGAKIGFYVGASLGGLAALALLSSDEDEAWGYALVGAAVYAGLGTGIGVGIDAMIESDRPIYARRQSGGATAFRLAPILGHERRGVQMAIRF
jgi:hypothetical protein